MKLTTTNFKKHIKKHGVTKARISEDYLGVKKGTVLGCVVVNNFIKGGTHTDMPEIIIFSDYKGTFEIEPDGTAVEEEEELSKCCGSIASWDFSFKSCKKCGKRFEPKHIHQMDTSEPQKTEDIGGEEPKQTWEDIEKGIKEAKENNGLVTFAPKVLEAYIKDNFISKEEIREMIEEYTWYKNDIGVKELEDNTWYIKVSDIDNLLNKLK